MSDGLSEVSGRGFLHLLDDESSDLGRRVVLALSLDPSVSVGSGNDLEGNVVDVTLHLGVLELPSNESEEDRQ